jgi:O-antigen/teichoic acid export membrane protein/glycosyltransferase involved in cell wall biosynthesis
MSQGKATLLNRQDRPLVEALLLCTYWLFLGILVILPVDGYLSFQGNGGVFVSQIVTIETGVMLLIYLAISAFTHRPARLPVSWLSLVPLVLLLLIGLASTAQAFSPSNALRETLKIVVYLGIFALGASARTQPNVYRHALIALLIGLGIVFLVALMNTTGKVPDIAGILLNIQHSPANLPFTSVIRLEATFRYPNELAAYLLIVLPILLAYALRTTEQRMRVVLILALLAGLWMLVYTYTRAALIAYIIVALVMLAILGGWRMLCAAIIALSLLTIGITLRGGTLSARLLSVLSGSDTAYQSRNIVRVWAWNAFRHHPLLGIGLGDLKLLPDAPYLVQALGLKAIDAENMYLNVLAELGILGFLAFLGALGGAIRRVWQGVRHQSAAVSTWNIGVLGALGALMIYGFADPVVVSGQVVGLLCGVVGLAGVLDAPTAPPSLATSGDRGAPADDGQLPVTQKLTAMRRMVFLVNAPGFGGANQHTLNIARGMQARGERVLIVAPPGTETISRAKAYGLPVRAIALGTNIGRGKGFLGVLAFMNPFGTYRAKRRILAIEAEDPSIFCCPFPREQLLTAQLSARSGLTSIWIVHAPLRYAAHRLFIQRRWVRASRRAFAVVAVSSRLGATLKQQGVALNRIEIIPNSVAVPPDDGMKDANRMPLLIGAAARLVKAKGIQHLIAAMPAILQRHPRAHLAIAGSGNYERRLREQVRRLGIMDHVEFLGYVDDLTPFLSSLHVLVHPTVDPGEVLPTVILEAASVGTPVVASDLASIPDEVRDGLTGLLVIPGDAQAIAQSVITLLDDPIAARAMGNAGRYLVAQEFALNRAVAAFTALGRAASAKAAYPGSASLVTTMPQAVIRRKALLGNSVIVLISKVLTAFATACWTVLAARTLLPSDYGNLALASGLVDLFTFFSDIGINAIATRELAIASPDEMRRLLGALMYLKVFLGVIGIASVIGITAFLPFHAGVLRIMFVLGPSLFFAALYSMTLVFRARASYTYLLIISLIVSIIGIGSAFTVAFFNGDVIAFATAQTITQICAGLLALLLSLFVFRPDLRPHIEDLARIFRKAVPIGIAVAVNILYYRIDVPLLGLLASSTEVAKYASTYRFLDVLTLLPASLQAATLPQMATLYKRNIAELREFAQQYLEIAASLGLFIGLLLSYSALPALDALYSGRYDSAQPTLQVLAWAGAATLLTNVFIPLAITLNQTRGLFIVSSVGLVVNVALNVALIPKLGSLAAAYATLATECVVILGMAGIVIRALAWRVRLLKPAGIAVVTVVAAWASQTHAFQALAWPVGIAALASGWLILIAPLLLVKSGFRAVLLKQ